ncbi:hypothetical protein GcC1_00611 [Golovinomyces cichoracearum]|uniref:Uncharacterized protein n=1 Tax=Golovinomyces cichoracearum TaxID=62708 RepID=A0A420HW13_9PEZI|nr:hypothetical protein GcC1_00611 [Golovinomyces cichoracearum]
MAIAPITGMLRRGLVLDLSIAFGTEFMFQRSVNEIITTRNWRKAGQQMHRHRSIIKSLH